ncbi:MAG: tRNA methyltransferase [Chlorobia bacterium]|nr:tRNA methyltransferase [Fimbriimonadaceae bacterium]
MNAVREDWNEIELAILLQDWSDPYNVGGMFRVADACGAKELILTGKSTPPPHPQVSVTSMGAHRRVEFRHFDGHEEAALALKEEGYAMIAVEVTDGAEHYMRYAYPAKVCLVLGNEQIGVYQQILKHCDGAVFIPMAGKGRSMNVHVAAAVVAFEILLGARD